MLWSLWWVSSLHSDFSSLSLQHIWHFIRILFLIGFKFNFLYRYRGIYCKQSQCVAFSALFQDSKSWFSQGKHFLIKHPALFNSCCYWNYKNVVLVCVCVSRSPAVECVLGWSITPRESQAKITLWCSGLFGPLSSPKRTRLRSSLCKNCSKRKAVSSSTMGPRWRTYCCR